MDMVGCEWKLFFFVCSRKHPIESNLISKVVDEVKLSPHGSESPVLNQSQDRAATRRADLRKLEQERRRREAVSNLVLFESSYNLVCPDVLDTGKEISGRNWWTVSYW